MSIDQDIQLQGQQAIPTHPADPHARGDDEKIVGEAALQTPDYNAPPSAGAIKSTGPAADPGVGDTVDASDAESGENQGGGDGMSAEVQPGR